MFKKTDYVYAVYKEKSFTKAAEKLYISQPCLSAAIKKIEDEIGMPLFERRYSAVQLTDIGLLYIEAAEKMMNAKQEFEARINDIRSLEYGTLSIGGSNYISSYILPKIVSRFSKLYPKISITLTEASSVELEKKLLSEELDMIIDSFDSENSIYACQPLIFEKILLAVPKNSSCNKGLEKSGITPGEIYNGYTREIPEISAENFKNESFILLKPGNNMLKHANNVFRQSEFTPNVIFNLDQLLTSYSLCASNGGVCFVTDSLFKYHLFNDDVILYNVKGSGNRTLYIAKKRNRYATLAMRRLTELAKENFRPDL